MLGSIKSGSRGGVDRSHDEIGTFATSAELMDPCFYRNESITKKLVHKL